ncbi:hypothetical protein [Streptomyces sp. NPDC056983]|uniref:hypothetical protein n=1 Tax=Streptomyces sp. NPDC056983 TaxID=3345987 RepID=UPI0036296EA1
MLVLVLVRVRVVGSRRVGERVGEQQWDPDQTVDQLREALRAAAADAVRDEGGEGVAVTGLDNAVA